MIARSKIRRWLLRFTAVLATVAALIRGGKAGITQAIAGGSDL